MPRQIRTTGTKGHTHIFSYQPGHESKTIETAIEQTRDPRTDIDILSLPALCSQIQRYDNPQTPKLCPEALRIVGEALKPVNMKYKKSGGFPLSSEEFSIILCQEDVEVTERNLRGAENSYVHRAQYKKEVLFKSCTTDPFEQEFQMPFY